MTKETQVEVIDLDSPVFQRIRSAGVPSTEAPDYSSDVSLPDIGPSRLLTRSVPVLDSEKRHLQPPSRRRRVPRQLSVVEDAIRVSSPTEAPDVKISPGFRDVIDLDSSSQETTVDVHDHSLEPVVSAQTISSKRPLERSVTVTFPIRKQTQSMGTPTLVSSNLLSTIDSLLEKPKTLKRRKPSPVETQETLEATDDNCQTSQIHEPRKKGTSRISSNLDHEKLQAKLLKQAEKERIKAEKERAKAFKLEEKRKAQSIAAVNVLKKSKKDSTSEMIVDACSSFDRSALGNHISSSMQELNCELNLSPMPVKGLVKFRRKTVAEFDNAKGFWIPLSETRVLDENHLIVIIKAADFLKIIETDPDLSNHVASVRGINPQALVLYMIEGLSAVMRKSQAARNRAYQAAVRAAGVSSESESSSRRRAPAVAADIDEEAIEDILMDLQIQHRCMIVYSTSPADTAEQLSTLISDISTIPYKKERGQSTAQFCTETGQIKTGSDKRDTFEKMLQSVSRVTPQVAQAIASQYNSLRELCDALKEGPRILERISKGHNADGTVTGQLLGTATAQKIYKALMIGDPHAEA